MNRRAFLAGAAALLAGPLAAEAHQQGKVPRIGYLSSGSATTSRLVEGFQQGLRELGWVEGQKARSPPTCPWSSRPSSSW